MKNSIKILATNKKAFNEYEIIETYEAGISLQGSEVKSIRNGRISLKDSYAKIKDNEIYLINCNISLYNSSSYFNHDPLRQRKLLMHKKEIIRLQSKVQQKGFTIIPLKIYLKKGIIKIEIALAKGKKLYDKREEAKRKAIEMEIKKALKGYRH